MRLTQATLNAAGTVTDGTSYIWEGDRVAEERDEDGVVLAVYEHGQELGPLRSLRPAHGTTPLQERFFIGDGQDSTRQLLDATNAVKDTYFYDAFGGNLQGGQGNSANAFKYTGQQQDASGLYYLRARYYDAGVGRFLSHDPVMGSSDDPDSFHRYLYTSADPVNGVDPTGKFTMANVMVTGAIIGALGGGLHGYVTNQSPLGILGSAILGDGAGALFPYIAGQSMLAITSGTVIGGIGGGLTLGGITAAGGYRIASGISDDIDVLQDPTASTGRKWAAGIDVAFISATSILQKISLRIGSRFAAAVSEARQLADTLEKSYVSIHRYLLGAQD